MRTKRAWSVVVLALVTVAAACGADDGDAAQDPAAPMTALAQTADEAEPTAADDGYGATVVAGGSTPSSALAVASSPVPTTASGSTADAETGATTSGEDSTGVTIRAATATTAPSTSSSARRPTTRDSMPSNSATTARVTSTTRRSSPSTATTARPTTTSRPATTTSTTSRPSGGGHFRTLPPGSALPSGDSCATRVKSRPETRAANAGYNRTRGSGSNDWNARVDGDFVGTTDEIIQWAACKWGIDEDWARAQAVKESWWDMTAGGDRTTDQSACYPAVRTSSGDCPESVGLLQVRYLYHGEAFEDGNALRSTAYNADYTYAVWRECYEGGSTWLNTVERGSEYRAGDLEGCLGVWFSGRWHLPNSDAYIADVRRIKNTRVWEQADFLGHG